MRNIIPPELRTVFLDDPESEKKLKIAYGRIFAIAQRNILERKQRLKLSDRENGGRWGQTGAEI